MAESQFTKKKIKLFLVVLVLVAILSVGMGVGFYFYYGHAVDASDISVSLQDRMKIGASFTVDDILESEGYKYGWMRSDVEVTVLVENAAYDEQDETSGEEYIPTQGILDYNDGTRTFTVCGVGAGIIDFRDPFDSSVSLQVPFRTHFDNGDTSEILEENYPELFEDGFVAKEEFDEVTELRLTTVRAYDVAELSACRNLSRFVLSSEEVITLNGLQSIPSAVDVYVTDGLYEKYLTDAAWNDQADRVYPIVDLSEGKHTIVFEFNSGAIAAVGDAPRTYASVSDGERIDLAQYPVMRTGYTLLGWFTSDDGGQTFSDFRLDSGYAIRDNLKVYAKWQANTYGITYHDTKFNTDVPASQTLTYDESGSLSADLLMHDGYTFLGWALTEGAAAVSFEIGEEVINLASENNAEINLYAVWAANAYDIVYDGNAVGVTNVPSRQEDIAFDTEVLLSAQEPYRQGYTFIGWAVREDALSYDYLPGETVKNLVSDSDGTVVLYAVWSANTYSIRYDPNGGANAPLDQENLIYGQEITLSSSIPVWHGRNFLGWSRDRDAATASYLAGATVSNLVADAGGAVTLYAVWEYDSFRIKYDANGGADAPDISPYISYNSASALLASGKPNRTGHTFIGWSYSSSGNVDYASGQSLSQGEINEMYDQADSDDNILVLYACWSVNSYKITVEKDGGSVTGVTSGSRYQYDQRITIKISYEHSDGRYVEVDGKNLGEKASYSFNMPAHDITIKVYSDDGCVATGTLITTADLRQVPIESLKVGDKVLAWDFVTQSFVETEITMFIGHGDESYDVLNLQFGNGSKLRTIGSHVLFDVTQNEYITINTDNYTRFMGHNFLCYDLSSGKYAVSQLTQAEVTQEVTGSYTIVTAQYFNYVSENVVTTSPSVPGLYELISSYVMDDLTFDLAEFEKDIAEYGLYGYEVFEDRMSYEQFVQLCGPYFKLAVEKGFTTLEKILEVLDYIAQWMVSGD